MQKCTLALGCFWKPEENFKSKSGIIQTEVGYAGGKNEKVTYEDETGATVTKELNGTYLKYSGGEKLCGSPNHDVNTRWCTLAA